MKHRYICRLIATVIILVMLPVTASLAWTEQAHMAMGLAAGFARFQDCAAVDIARTIAMINNLTQTDGQAHFFNATDDYVLTVDDVKNSVRFPDAVFCCANHLDIHRKGYVEYVTRNTNDPYYVPYRSLVAKGVDNLLAAGRCISAEHPVMGAIRVMPPCFAMGQAAGTAAAISAAEGIPVRKVDAGKLILILQRDGVYLP